MNPFNENPRKFDDILMDWPQIYPAPYDKNTVDPYTRTRVILMNGTEFEANWFTHQLSRHCPDNDVRRQVALIRRSEQQQQKLISMLKPPDETILEHTIGYEQLAVDLTAGLAELVPDRHVKMALDFALLEDFDHLYRYANLLEMESGVYAETLVGHYTEVMPARPTISEHNHPYDTIKKPIDSTADLATKLAVGTITAAEQQTMNFYMNTCGIYQSEIGRKLYQEIGMIEEQHVTHYGSLMDVSASWLECLLMHQYTECWLYWSCAQSETDPRIQQIWQMLLEQEITHLHAAADLLKEYERKDWQQVIPGGEFPAPIVLKSNIEYVRGVLRATVTDTAVRESYAKVSELKPDFDFFSYQNIVNRDVAAVPSHMVIDQAIARNGQDYRWETERNPIAELQNRKKDNVTLGREPAAVMAGRH